eukprot:tig00020560_g11096.t1
MRLWLRVGPYLALPVVLHFRTADLPRLNTDAQRHYDALVETLREVLPPLVQVGPVREGPKRRRGEEPEGHIVGELRFTAEVHLTEGVQGAPRHHAPPRPPEGEASRTGPQQRRARAALAAAEEAEEELRYSSYMADRLCAVVRCEALGPARAGAGGELAEAEAAPARRAKRAPGAPAPEDGPRARPPRAPSPPAQLPPASARASSPPAPLPPAPARPAPAPAARRSVIDLDP